MEFHDMQERAYQVRQVIAEYERRRYGRVWTDEEIMLGLVGDLGDLSKLVQARNGIRSIPDVDAKMGHELSDCLWSIMVLARAYSIDLESAFMETMDGIEKHVAANG